MGCEYSAPPTGENMTAQLGENLYIDGQLYSMTCNPLCNYFALAGIDPGFESNCTALWRGYIGTWEIVDNRLYLTELSGTLEGDIEATVATFFPDFPDRVFAHWYTGTIRIPQGKLLEYVHMGYGSMYERDLILKLEKGVVIDTLLRHNGKADDSDAPEGYSVGAMTIFSRGKVVEGNR